MYFHIPSLLTALAIAATTVTGTPVNDGSLCDGQTVVSESFIGKDKNVKVEQTSCIPSNDSSVPPARLNKRQTVGCGDICTRHCFIDGSPAGSGPDPNECHVIADALLFESQNTGANFLVGTGAGNDTVSLTYRSCFTFFRNQGVTSTSFCRTQWASVIDDVAFNCQAPQGAHGGNCVAGDQLYFIQLQHS